TQAIARRTGRCARAARTDLQGAPGVDPGDRATTRANLDDVHHRRLDRVARSAVVPLDAVLGRDLVVAVFDQRALGSGATDVHGDQVRFTDELAKRGRANDATYRPRFDQMNRLLCHKVEIGRATIRLHDVKRSTDPLVPQARSKLSKI